MKKLLFILLILAFFTNCYSITETNITLMFNPQQVKLDKVGQIFKLDVELVNHPIPSDIMGVEMVINFDSNYLMVTDMLGNEVSHLEVRTLFQQTQVVLVNIVDNQTGRIHYAIGGIYCEEAISTPVVVCSIYFKVKKRGGTRVNFDRPNCLVAIGASATQCENIVSIIIKNVINAEIGDTTPPIIQNIKEIDTSPSSTIITWTTNEPSTTEINYGLTMALGNYIKKEGEFTTQHQIKLTKLEPLTKYYYKIIAVDTSGNRSESELSYFRTNNKDEEPPVIEHEQIISATAYKKIKIEARVTDNREVKTVALYYRKSTAPSFHKINMSKKYIYLYQAEIKEEEVVPPYIEYYIEAEDISLNKIQEPITGAIKIEIKTQTGELAGRVLTTDGNPIKDAKIFIKGTDIFGVTNEEGAFTIASIPIGKYRIEVVADKFVTKIFDEIEIREARSTFVTFLLEESGIISGVVRNKKTNLPVEAATVILIKRGETTPCKGCVVETNIKGEYYITGFPKDTYNIECKKRGFGKEGVYGLDLSLPMRQDFSLSPLPLQHIDIEPNEVILKPNEVIQFTINAINIDNKDVRDLGVNIKFRWYVYPSGYGEINDDGLFRAGNYEGSCKVKVEGTDENGRVIESDEAKIEIVSGFRFKKVLLCDGNSGCNSEVDRLRRPFNPRKDIGGVQIRYKLTAPAYEVIIKIYNVRGRLVREIRSYTYSLDDKINWDGYNNLGELVPNGVYIYQITAKGKDGVIHSKPQLIGVFKR